MANFYEDTACCESVCEATLSSQEVPTLEKRQHINGGMREFEVRENIVLAPLDLINPTEGIMQQIRRNLLKYTENFKGVVLCFDLLSVQGDPKVLDSGYVLVQVRARYYTFSPEEGDRLLGTVSKVGDGQVACLVYNCFNASVELTEGGRGYEEGEEVEFVVRVISRTKDGILAVMGTAVEKVKKKRHKHKKRDNT